MFDNFPIIRRIALPFILVVFGLSLHGQEVDPGNPFDLVYRLDKTVNKEESQKGKEDIRPPESEAQSETTELISPEQSEKKRDTSQQIAVNEKSPVVSPAPEEKESVKTDSVKRRKLQELKEVIPIKTQQPLDQSRTLLFVFFVFQLILLTFSVSLERSEVHRLLRAMANDNYLNLVHRDLKGKFPLQYWIFYVIFVSQLSLFLWLSFQHSFINGRLSFWFCLLAISGIYVMRHFSMKMISYIFPVEREANQFNFTIAVFNMLLGLFLLPVNAFLAFAAPTVAHFCFYIGLVLIFGFYVLRQLRGLFIASEYVMFHRIHFFLYLCTVEIAPVVILLKFFFML